MEAFLGSATARAIGAAATAQRLTGSGVGRVEQLEVSMRAVGVDSVTRLERLLRERLDEVPLLLRALRGRNRRATISGDLAHWISFVLVTVAAREPDRDLLATDSGWDAAYIADAVALREVRASDGLEALAARARVRGGAGLLGAELSLRPWDEPPGIPTWSRADHDAWPLFAAPGGRSIAGVGSVARDETVAWDDYRFLVRRAGAVTVSHPIVFEAVRLRPGRDGQLIEDGATTLSLHRDEELEMIAWNEGRPLVRLAEEELAWLPADCCWQSGSALAEWWVRLADGEWAGLWMQLARNQFGVPNPAPRPPALRYQGPGAFASRTGTPSIDGARLVYWIEGAGPDGAEDAGAAPLFVLHGGPGLGSAYLREPLTRTLGARRTLFFFDQRGSGYAEGADEPASLTMGRLVRDLETIRLQAGLDRIDLLGHSFGGLLALRYAIAYPERVGRLVLVDPDPATRPEWATFADVLAARTDPADADRMVGIAATPGWDDDPEAFGAWFALRLRAYTPDPSSLERLALRFDEVTLRNQRITAPAIRADLGDWDLRDRLGRIRAPTLIVGGADSVFPRTAYETVARGIAGAELVLFEGVGHFPFVEVPERFAEVVLGFLDRTQD